MHGIQSFHATDALLLRICIKCEQSYASETKYMHYLEVTSIKLLECYDFSLQIFVFQNIDNEFW